MSGRGTSGGVVFQAEVGAYVAGLLLTERPLSRIADELPGTPQKVLFETTSPVDDILIQTDAGEIYVQAKRTISLSSKGDSELASVVEQFVRQFRIGVTDPSLARRDLDPVRDRLLLAVSDDTAAPVASQLREALNRNRTGAATGLPAKLAEPLKTFAEHIETEWLKITGSPIREPQKQSLLAVCSVAVFAAPQRQLVEEACRDVVAALGDERTLIELLAQWAAEAAKSGVGGDVAAIRLALSGKIRLKEPPSFNRDIARLADHTSAIVQRLQRFTEIASPEGVVNIARPVASVVSEAARKGSLVITGDPGAGKSALLHAVAGNLAGVGVVVALTVEATATSLDSLRADIGLEHPLIEVLKNLPPDRPAFLVLDALDAVRGGPAEGTYKRLVDEVSRLPGWHVVASVRTFDLRLGRDWKRLFMGRPFDDDRADPTLQSVRHVHVGLLDAFEMADLATKSPSIATAIMAGGAKMETLARTPFNVAILGDLLSGGVLASALASVGTRGELLQRYWDERITDLGLPATVSLKGVVDQMLDTRSIDRPETSIAMAAASTIQELERVGVLVTETTRRIGFRHHVLFDFAVARLILLPEKASAVDRLSKSRGAGLLISPSLGYWLDELKKTVVTQEFWSLIARLITGPDIDPIVRVEVARLAVESVGEDDRLDALLPLLESQDATLSGVLMQLVGALLCKTTAKRPILASPWADLLGKISKPTGGHLGSMRTLTGILLDEELGSEDRSSLGKAARVMFDAIGTDQRLVEWLSPQVV